MPDEKEGPWAREYRQGRAEQVKQQRIANLIALSNSPRVSSATRNYAVLVAANLLEVEQQPAGVLACTHGSYWTDHDGRDHCLVCPHVSEPDTTTGGADA